MLEIESGPRWIARKRLLFGFLLGLISIASGFVPNAVAEAVPFSFDADFQVPVERSCVADFPACGFLSIYRDRRGSANVVKVSFSHAGCLDTRGDRTISRKVSTVSNRFHVKVDRAGLKLKVRGRFIDFDRKHGGPHSEVKGFVSFRNLNRKCGLKKNFRRDQWQPPTQ